MNHVRSDPHPAVRQAVRDWLKSHFPTALAGAPAPQSGHDDPKHTAWKEAVGRSGWGTPTWPTAYGGAGLSPSESVVVREEFARAGAYNPIRGLGVMMLGPTLLEFGTEAQKHRHLPPISSGELQWCQGFSEPGAGSDLAALQTRAVDCGDHFLVDGQKVWTSGAQYADWCFCLVRTDPSRKHDGISLVLFPMRQAGVDVYPLKLIAGHSPFCEMFLTSVRAERSDLVGPLNGGWNIAKRLLQHERAGLSGVGADPSDDKGLGDLAKAKFGVDAEGRLADGELRARIVSNEMDAKAFQLTLKRGAAETRANSAPTAVTSVMKNAGTRVLQERQELTIEILGHQGLGWDGEAFKASELSAVRSWLTSRATTIYGGSAEVQTNIIAKRILGLPDALKASQPQVLR